MPAGLVCGALASHTRPAAQAARRTPQLCDLGDPCVDFFVPFVSFVPS
jgi:hypothetical protein